MAPPTAPIPLAAIDAGSNAIRVIIANATSPTQFSVVEAERVPVRLGHHTFTHGELDRPTIENALIAFARFRKLFDQYGIKRYRAVATSALRNASNREDLLDRIYREVGIEVEVIDGEEEARLVRKAVLHAGADREPPRLICDLGGGSLEITTRVRDDWQTSSMRIGTVRLLETFGLSGAVSEDEARMIRRFVTSTLSHSLPPESMDPAITSAVACGGNAEALAGLLGGGEKDGVPTFKAAALEEMLPKILNCDVPKRMERFNVRQDRAEVMGVAALVFATVAEHLKLKRFVVPGVGIREGVLLDLAEASIGELPAGREPHTVAMARTFAARIGHNTAHGEQVRRIATSLFNQLRELHGLNEDMSVVLQLAALLHDVGEVIHRQSHHKHSEYLILNGRIPGMDSPLRELVAAVARAHRKSSPVDKKHPTYQMLSPEHQSAVRKLAALLRIADSLDTDHRQRIVALSTEIKPKKVTLHVSVAADEGVTPPGGVRKAEAFEAEFDRKLICTVAGVSAKPRVPIRSE